MYIEMMSSSLSGPRAVHFCPLIFYILILVNGNIEAIHSCKVLDLAARTVHEERLIETWFSCAKLN